MKGIEVMDDDKLQDLKNLLDKNLQDFHDKWAGMSPAELVEASREITAIRDAYEYLIEEHWFEPEEVALFLRSENPLELVADKWRERMGDMSDFDFALDEVFKELEKRDVPQAGKPSILGKLQEKSMAVKPHISDAVKTADKEAR